MNKILFQINYDVIPSKRDEYLQTAKELEEYIKNHTQHNYMIVEDKNRQNSFTEVYILKDEAEFDGLEDEMDDQIYNLTTKILSEYVVDGKTKYSTFYQI
ncbi:MAG: hypothetical protein IT280_00635 [Ignavibacteria bacterium]|nr:hypothetical protein [Ignavibacteria bacterium]